MYFRKRIRLFPGFTVNLSKSGMSATIGVRGASVNVGGSGVYLNTGIPGTGLYNRTPLGPRGADPAAYASSHESPPPAPTPAIPIPTGVEIKSYHPTLITSENLYGLRDAILKADETKKELAKEKALAATARSWWLVLVVLTHILVFGFFVKALRERYQAKREEAEHTRKAYEDFRLHVSFNFDRELLNDYMEMCDLFGQLTKSQRLWDVTSSKAIDRVRERSFASTAITRTPVSFSRSHLDFLHCEQESLHLRNANGADLHLYPGFIAMVNSDRSFGFVDIRDVEVSQDSVRFVETDVVPSDSRVVDRTWRYVNKNGAPDRRFKDNYEIPVAAYHEFFLRSASGMNEGYMVSNPDIGEAFCRKLVQYQATLKSMKWEALPETITPAGTLPAVGT